MASACTNLASQIEASLFDKMKEEISSDYGKKFRDLLTALKNDQNVELREGLLTGSITSNDFVEFGREKLIPKKFLLQRDQAQKKFFEDNVFINSDKPATA